MAHGREAKRKATAIASMADGSPSAVLFPDEVAAHRELVASLTASVKPKGIADELAIDRLAMALVRARRLDASATAGNPSAVKMLYFADLTIQHWITKLGIDRRFRVTRDDDETRRSKDVRKLRALWGGGGTEAPKGIDLERPDAPPIDADDRVQPGDDAREKAGATPKPGNGTGVPVSVEAVAAAVAARLASRTSEPPPGFELDE